VQGVTVANFPSLTGSDAAYVVDFYDPFLIETLHGADEKDKWDDYNYRLSLSSMNVQARLGDFFMCASEQQRDYWLGVLSGMGRLNPRNYRADSSFRSLIDIVPFGIEAEPPKQTRRVLKGVLPGISDTDKVILWGGGIYEWFDPFSLIRAMRRVSDACPDARLFFLGARHPNPAVGYTPISREAMGLAKDLGLYEKCVFFHPGWVPYEERGNYLVEADVGASTHLDCIETRFAFRTRLLDCIWASLPIVTTRGGALTEMVEKHGLGRVVDYRDEDGIADALIELLVGDAREELRENFRQVGASLTWDAVSKPLRDFCANPRKAPDREAGMIVQGEAATGEFKTPPTLLGKGILYLRMRGPVELLKKVREYFWWRLQGPK
jgi:glycosyltransferase involved in cell wall biosynthesis